MPPISFSVPIFIMKKRIPFKPLIHESDSYESLADATAHKFLYDFPDSFPAV